MRNSRWSTAAIKQNGQIVATRFVEGDSQLLKYLAVYSNLDISYLAALTGRSYPAIAGRTNKSSSANPTNLSG